MDSRATLHILKDEVPTTLTPAKVIMHTRMAPRTTPRWSMDRQLQCTGRLGVLDGLLCPHVSPREVSALIRHAVIDIFQFIIMCFTYEIYQLGPVSIVEKRERERDIMS